MQAIGLLRTGQWVVTSENEIFYLCEDSFCRCCTAAGPALIYP